MKHYLLFAWVIFFISGCQMGKKDTLFEKLSPDQTGVTFANTIPTDENLNFVEYTYVYNGAGVGVGDFNNDGLQDIFFAGNIVNNKLYLNKGNFEFEDISQSSGIDQYNRWCTGVALVDINSDGFLDVYVSAADIKGTEDGRNLLFVNNGDLTFTEQAEAYGIDDIGFSTQGAFFDYDKDGDLDLYVLTNAESNYSSSKPRAKFTDGSAKSNDKLYENTGIGPDGHPVYKDVTEQAGIIIEGHGLGIGIADLNMDGWPDVYTANDFLTNDLVWINNGDGTFYNAAPEYTKHQTHNGMGMDINDFNNDGLPDIYVLDMLPQTNYRRKTMIGAMNYESFQEFLHYDYQPQYLRNTLQINNGKKPGGGMSFSEIGQYAGIESTDWSWAALFADYDHDGLKDLWVTNGYRKNVTDMDYVMTHSQDPRFFAGRLSKEELKKVGEKLGGVKLSNLMYKNNGDLTFDNVTEQWGIELPSYSNGGAFADFDNDGDLDLVVNNIDEEAFLFRNNMDPGADKPDKNYLRIKLKGPEKNVQGLGTKLTLKAGDKHLYHDHSVYRGYKSSVENTIHFGIGKASVVDELKVTWLDGSTQLLTNVKANRVLTIDFEDARPEEDIVDMETPRKSPALFNVAADNFGIDFSHDETDFEDFKFLPLLPHKFSQSGPGVAVGDINGDGREDFVVGGSVRRPTNIFTQRADGTFAYQKLELDSVSEDMGLLLLDVDNDDDLDLFAVSGSVEFYPEHKAYQDRLYLNDGNGNFSLADGALPEYIASGTVVTAADYDKDGDLDLFVGGNMIPRKYPDASRSVILKNENGKFSDVTDEIAKGLSGIGIVKSGLWTDFDNDGWIDLVVVGEWTPITFYKNNEGVFENITATTGIEDHTGWWNSIIGDDFDGDGDIDYVAGNYGLNNQYRPTHEEPLRAYVSDYDNNSVQDAILTYYINGKEYPVNALDALIAQMSTFRGRFKDYATYGNSTFDEVFSQAQIEASKVYKATEFGTSYIENLGNGKFEIKRLPAHTQFAPVFGMKSDDYDGDGNKDLLLVGNYHAIETINGWQDALPGAYLKGDGNGNFDYIPLTESGFVVESDAKALVEIYVNNEPKIIVSSNQDSLKFFDVNGAIEGKVIQLSPNDAYAVVTTTAGKTYKEEFYYGSGYLSQSSRTYRIPVYAEKVEVYDYNGKKRVIDLKTLTANR